MNYIKILSLFLLIQVNCSSTHLTKLEITSYKYEYAHLEPIIFEFTVLNNRRVRNDVYMPSANHTLKAEIRKSGSSAWQEVLLIDPILGTNTDSDFSANLISVGRNKSVKGVIGISPYTYSGEKIIYPYSSSGKYEIRFIWQMNQSRKIKSNIKVFEFEGSDITPHLEKLEFPYFIFESITFGMYLIRGKNKTAYKNTIAKITKNFPDSSFSEWAKLFFLESKIYYNLSMELKQIPIDDTLEELKRSKNPLIRLKTSTLISTMKKQRK